MQERYEANLDGEVVLEQPNYNYDEIKVLNAIFRSLNLECELDGAGRGGYVRYRCKSESSPFQVLNIYLKKVTFGGRENRPFEKRAQFSAALDRTGYDRKDENNEVSLILGLYKGIGFDIDDTIICAWYIDDWGKNIGRAFNCFIDIRKISEAILDGVSQHITSTGQIAYAFKIDNLKAYLSHYRRAVLHKKSLNPQDLFELFASSDPDFTVDPHEFDNIPKFDELFQLIIDVLKLREGIGNNGQIEEWVGDKLGLSEFDLYRIHNSEEGSRTELGYRLAWARFYLKKAGYLDNPQRGVWVLTALGYSSSLIDKEAIKRLATQQEFDLAERESIVREGREEDGVEIEIEENFNTEDITSPFDPNKVDIRTRSMSMDLLLKRMRTEAIDMNTSFQRRAGLWTLSKKSQLIESILIRIPLPVFYFDGSEDDRWLIVDGLQRLSTLDEYVNRQSFALQGLEYLKQFNSLKFTELPNHLQRRIEEFEITAYVISPGTPVELKFNIFKRINTGGLILTAQEIRNALYPNVSLFLSRLADSSSFKRATNFSISDKRMLDREFVLRFLAFRLLGLESYSGDLDAYLNKALNVLAEIEPVNKANIENDFYQAMDLASDVFGIYAFRKRYSDDWKKYPINKALFEAWSVLLSQLDAGEQNLLSVQKELVNRYFIELMDDDLEFNAAITSGTNKKQNVHKRFEAIDNIIQSVLPL